MTRSPIAHILLLIAFVINTICPMDVWAYVNTPLQLPKSGTMVHLSAPMNSPILKGIKVHADNPFRFDFILDKGDVGNGRDRSLTDESTRLIKYFLASLTVPEKDLWVTY